MTHRAPDPTKCAACGAQDTVLAECTTCKVRYCREECFSLHREPEKAEAAR